MTHLLTEEWSAGGGGGGGGKRNWEENDDEEDGRGKEKIRGEGGREED